MKCSLATFAKIKKGKMTVVFGCGGQRDRQKRPKMGRIACEYADRVIITTDNPRNEDPLSIIQDISKGCNGKEEIVENRKEAIKKAVKSAAKSDIIIITGKGAEKHLLQGNTVQLLNDKALVLSILKEEDG